MRVLSAFVRWVLSSSVGLGLVAALTVVFAAAHPASAVVLQDGLVANWTLDDGIGDANTTTAVDWVNGNDASLGGFDTPPSWLVTAPPAQLAGALSFDGTDDYALVPNSPSLDLGTNAVTISTWVKLDELPSAMDEAFGAIYDSNEDAYVVYVDRGNTELRFKVTDSDGTAARPGIPESMLDTTDWHHVAAVYDGGAGVARIYLDGELADMHADDGAGSDALVDAVKTGQVAAIGRNGAVESGYLAGDVDDTAVWNRALSEGEVKYLFNSGAGQAVAAGNPTVAGVEPVVYLPMQGDVTNQGTGGSTYDGTIVDGPNGTHGYASGPAGQSLDLENQHVNTDGDYVSIPYTMPDQGTLALWYYVEDYYNYQAVLDNSVEPNDWEMWVYNDGRARFRIQGDSAVTFDVDNLDGPDNWYHFAMTWFRTGNTVALNMYVNGELRDVDEGAWVDPGDTFFLGGGSDGNMYGDGIWDELRIYDTVLNSEEIMALVPEPGTLLLLAGLPIALLLWRRRRPT